VLALDEWMNGPSLPGTDRKSFANRADILGGGIGYV
jgi:hypothetical protein